MTSERLFGLLREELEQHVGVLRGHFEAAERSPDGLGSVPELLEATTSLRGAVRVAGLSAIEPLVVAIETCLPFAVPLEGERRDLFVEALGVLARIGESTSAAAALGFVPEAERLAAKLHAVGGPSTEVPPSATPVAGPGSTMELFALECETHAATLSEGLLLLERAPHRTDLFDKLMRAAHCIKGAARVVALEPAVNVAHVVEDHLARARRDERELGDEEIEALLHASDALAEIGAKRGQADPVALGVLAERIRLLAPKGGAGPPRAPAPATMAPPSEPRVPVEGEDDRVLRVRASHLSEMVGLASEALVEAGRSKPFVATQRRLHARQADLSDLLNDLHQTLGAPSSDTPVGVRIAELRARIEEGRSMLSRWQEEFEEHARHGEELTLRMYREATASRMRPLSDGLQAFPRMVRDLSRKLGKKVGLAMTGSELPIDRDILERIEAPLNHIVRNAVDHGIEPPDERRAAGKPETGVIELEARHRAGTLDIVIRDDGRGLDAARIRERVVALGLLPAAEAARVEETQIFDYIFAPGLSTADAVSEISGRGVGMDVVQSVLHEIGGAVHVASAPGRGTAIHLTLPVSRSVLRGVVVSIAGEPYAFPLARIDRLLAIPVADVEAGENGQSVPVDGRSVALVPAAQILELDGGVRASEAVSVVVVSDRAHRFAFVVDRLLGEFDLLVRPLDPRIGRVADVSAAAILPDGAPVLILDVDDLIRSVARLLQVARIETIAADRVAAPRTRRILVVDDSLSVRELQKRLLTNRGYEVEVAADGHAGWSRVREGAFDLVILDIDMPRMDGLALTRSIKQDARVRHVPVMLLSYRDSKEDRARGLEAGATAYLTKSTFEDEAFVDAVVGLVGEPTATAAAGVRP